MQRLDGACGTPRASLGMRCPSFTFILAVMLGASTTCLAQTASKSQFERGAQIYAQHCALCHGVEGRGGQGFAGPIWGAGHDIAKFGSARGLFEYVQLLMPFDNPQKITDEEKLAVVAFMLMNNGTIGRDQTLEPSKAAATPIK